MLYDNCPCDYDSLSEFTKKEIEKIMRLECPIDAKVQSMLVKYKKELATTNRLHLRSNHVQYSVSTLDHFRFLVSIGMEIVDIRHAILFASLTPEGQSLHPFRQTIGDLLGKREAMQREKERLCAQEELSGEELRRVDLLTTLAFLAKIR